MKKLLWAFIFSAGISGVSRAQLPSVYETSSEYISALELFRLGQFEAASASFERWQQARKNGGKNGLSADYSADAEYYNALCSWYLDRPDAEQKLRNFLSTYPAHASAPMARIWLARNTFRNKLYRETLQELAPVKIPDAWLPDSVNNEVRYMAGICWYQYREYEKSLRYFSDLSREESPWKTEALRYSGVLNYELSKYPEALEILTQLPMDQQTTETVLARARSYYETQALDELTRFTLEVPDNLKDPELYLTLAASAARTSNYAAALEWFDTYQQHKTLLNPALRYQYAFAAFKEHKYSTAIPVFEQLVTQPDSISSLSSYYLAFSLLKEGKTESARLAFMRAASEKAPSSITEDAILQYAKISYQEKFFQDAMSQLKIYLKKYPQGQYVNEARSLIGEVLFYASNYRESVEYFESAKISDERSLSAYQRSCYYYGLELYRKKAYRESDVYFRKGYNLNHDPSIAAACRYWYAESQFRQGYYEEANRQYDTFLDIEMYPKPDYYTEAWYGKGWAQLKQQKAADASEAFIKYINLADKNKFPDLYQDALLRAGDCEFSLKNYREAQKYFTEAALSGRGFTDYALWRTGQIQYRLEKYPDAVNTFKKVVQLHKESEYRDDALDQMAETSLKWLIDYKAASQYSRTLIQEYPQSEYVPAAWNRMGIAAYNSNDKPAAEKYFRKVLTDYCQDTATAVSALNNMSFIVSSEEYVEVFSQYRKACPEVNTGLELLAWETALDKYQAEAWSDALPMLNLYLKDFPLGNYRTEALYYRAVSLDKTGQTDKSIDDFHEVAQSKIYNEWVTPSWLKLGEIYKNKSQWEQASEAFNKAREFARTPEDKFFAGYEEISALQAAVHTDKALEVTEALQILPGLSMTRKQNLNLKKADLLLARKDTSLAMAEYSALREQAKGTRTGAEAGYKIISIYIASGNIDAAETAGLELKDLYPGFPEWIIRAYIILADAYILSGDDYQAGALLEYILSQSEDYYPGMKEEARQRQAKLQPEPAPAPEKKNSEPGKKNKK